MIMVVKVPIVVLFYGGAADMFFFNKNLVSKTFLLSLYLESGA